MAEDKESVDLKESPDPMWSDGVGPAAQPAGDTEEAEKEESTPPA